MQSPDNRQRWVSFDEARMILRMTEGTLRRAIKAGTVTAEQRRRNPDSATDLRMVYEVLVTDPPDGASDSKPGHPPGQSPPSATEPPGVATRAMDILAEALTEERTERQRLAVENAELRERVGRAEAVAASATANATILQAELDRLRARRWWWLW